jgi:uncharacterized protein YkwD
MQVHNLVNQARLGQGLQPLAYDGALAAAAQSYAQLMANSGCFSHTCPPVTYFVDRVVAAGYTPWLFLGENIAGGQQTAQQVVQDWMNSSGHRANILNANYKDLGVGVAYGGYFGIYWVQEFGSQP